MSGKKYKKMQKTELAFFENNLNARYEYYPFYETFNSIKLLIEIKSENEKKLRGVYYTVLIQCTTLIEGMIGQIINSSIKHRFYELQNLPEKEKQFHQRILENLERTISDSYFRDLSKNWELVYGQNLIEAIIQKDKELWKSINTLFKIRNLITHGNILKVEYNPTENNNEFEINVLDKYKIIYSFLIENKLLEKDDLGMVHLVNKRVVKFFINETEKFINAIILSIPDVNYLSLAVQKYQKIKNQLL